MAHGMKLHPCRIALSLFCLGIIPAWPQTAPKARAAADDQAPVRSVIDPGVITTRQALTPAGIQMVFRGKVHGVAFGASSEIVYALSAGAKGALVTKLDLRTNRVIEQIQSAAAPGMQAIAFDKASGSPVIAGIGSVKVGTATRKVVQLVGSEAGKPRIESSELGRETVGGVALTNTASRSALVALTFNNELAVVGRATGEARKVKTGIAPFGVIANAAETVAYVTNWGGRFPKKGDKTAPTGNEPGADQAVVDERGIASSGTIARVDLKTLTVTHTIEVGRHPTAMALDETRGRLYVANSNSDTVSVVDTRTHTVLENIPIQPFARKVAGVAPEALALTRDGQRLYVACAGLNAVAVLAVSRSANRIEGLIPTGWYPSHIALSPDEGHLAVSTLLGVGSGWRENQSKRYVHAYRGTLHVIPVPDAIQLAGYTTAVAENNRMQLPGGAGVLNAGTVTPAAKPLPVPMRAGDPSPIQHIVYIVKENRSYDQYFGDIAKGNGDPSLQLVGDDVIPNQRRLAQEFVLLDNFYANGGNSASGHQWVTQAAESDYTYWPGYGGRSYPKSGEDPLAFANSGFLWDNALAKGRTFENFGEFVGVLSGVNRMKLLEEYRNGGQFEGTFNTVAPIEKLNKYLVKDYPAYSLQVPDVVRARIFQRHIKRWEASGRMPNLVMMHLPSDHTSGVTPDYSTPNACFADNDLALGQVVEGLTHSKFWKNMLILVVEDDAQAGLDHVDGHRAVALAISPYIRRGAVDSTFYSQASFAKTVELILGLPAMTLFDLIANDMRNSFQTTPDYTPYKAEAPRQSIYEANPKLNALNGPALKAARESMRMNFREPDVASTGKVNRMIWASVRGWNAPYPAAKRGAFLPSAPSDPEDEDEDEDENDH